MENRYLFRGKRIDNGEWMEGYLIVDEKDYSKYFIGYVFGTNEDGTPHDLDAVQVDSSTICQCTERTDQDKTLIFEHDVVAYLDTYSTESGYAEADCVGEVVWDEETLSFQVTNRLSAESWEVIDGECKVIGNTLDNPELLE